MDELVIDGKTYVSSKEAAKRTGYAKDYVGQLCREGRVEAKLVGRSWYVYEPSLNKHRFSEGAETVESPKAETAWGGLPSVPPTGPELEPSEITNIKAVWEVPSYLPEEVQILPELDPEPAVSVSIQQVDASEPLSDMQSAWQEWFSTREARETEAIPVAIERHDIKESSEPARREEEMPEVSVRSIVSDIQPIVVRKEEPLRSYAPTHTVPVPVAVKRRQTKKKASSGSQRIVKAAFVAVIAISISVALVSTGFINALHLAGTSDIGIIRFIEGSSVIEN